jgi:hypothetical protein
LKGKGEGTKIFRLPKREGQGKVIKSCFVLNLLVRERESLKMEWFLIVALFVGVGATKFDCTEEESKWYLEAKMKRW